MFLAQVLSADGSCQQAVDEAVIKRILGGLPVRGASTSAYCQARGRLRTEVVSTLTRQIGGMIGAGAPSWWHCWNRPVRLLVLVR